MCLSQGERAGVLVCIPVVKSLQKMSGNRIGRQERERELGKRHRERERETERAREKARDRERND